jgi:Family of unknown function (DUF5677)
MALHQKHYELNAYVQRLMDVGIAVVADAKVEVGERWAKEPKVIALALLCRTLGNLKGAVLLLQQRMLVEAQVLTRCCVENLICVGALSHASDAFVDELIRADAHSKKKLVKSVIKTYAEDIERTKSVVRLKEVVKAIEASHPKTNQLNTQKLSENNPVGASYLQFSVLSERAVHVSASSLGRHLGRELDGKQVFLKVDIAPESSEESIVSLQLELLGTVLGVVVGVNEIVGGTEPGRELNTLMKNFEVIRDM